MFKKFLIVLSLLSLAFLVAGCEKETQYSCTLSRTDRINNYSLESTYNIFATGETVNKVHTKEKVTSEDGTIISSMEEYFKNTYDAMNEAYGGYKYDITSNDDMVVADVTIDYSKVDLKKLTEDEPTMDSILKDGKMNLDNLKAMYEEMGATCK